MIYKLVAGEFRRHAFDDITIIVPIPRRRHVERTAVAASFTGPVQLKREILCVQNILIYQVSVHAITLPTKHGQYTPKRPSSKTVRQNPRFRLFYRQEKKTEREVGAPSLPPPISVQSGIFILGCGAVCVDAGLFFIDCSAYAIQTSVGLFLRVINKSLNHQPCPDAEAPAECLELLAIPEVTIYVEKLRELFLAGFVEDAEYLVLQFLTPFYQSVYLFIPCDLHPERIDAPIV